ncbi:MAG: LTA synthase family protein [Actinobacteria bacterium]|nr:LTA synthase family protein [Actinomycetota bacterium]
MNPSPRPSRKAAVIGWSLTAVALILLATAGWIRYRFGVIVLEQFILHIPVGGEEAGNDNLVLEALVVCILIPLGLVGLAALLHRRRGWSLRGWVRVGVLTIALTVSLGTLLTVIGVPQYAAAQFDGRTFADYYVTPQAGRTPEKPKNLITIYLESMENTFSDSELFGRNLLSELDEATAGWARYDGLQQYPGGGWTMAGIISTQCGIPLKSRLLVKGINPNDFGEQVDNYLPGATCLGDVLADAGYTNTYVGGAHTRFAGKNTFLRDHGFTSIRGRERWEPGEDPSDVSIWGISDVRMFAHAADTVDELRERGEPFHLSMLTLDTHEPAALYSTCGTDDAVKMATAIVCSTRALAGFLNHLAETGALEDTVVVVMGDHLKSKAEGGDFNSELEAAQNRTIVLRILSPDPVEFTRPTADQFSMLPTILELLDLDPPDGRAGLGVSFVGDHPLAGTAPELDPSEYVAVVTSPSSELYQGFWQPRH